MIVNGRLGREWIGGAGNNQPTKYWLDGAATHSATDEKNEQTVVENAKIDNGQGEKRGAIASHSC